MTAYELRISDWSSDVCSSDLQRANTRAIDSLLNYETVKYFTNEEHEARRSDEAMERYEYAAVKSQTTLDLLNIGQGVIIAIGQMGAMSREVIGVRDGSMTISDNVMAKGDLTQHYLATNYLGCSYGDNRPRTIALEQMFARIGEV